MRVSLRAVRAKDVIEPSTRAGIATTLLAVFSALIMAADGRASDLAVASFLEKHCYDCHTGKDAEAGLDLQTLPADLTDAEIRRRWVHLHDRVASGEMPPKDKYKPTPEAKTAFLTMLGNGLTQADLASREVSLRRLTRTEYENTARDLFGIYVDVQRLLPADTTEQGFDNTGSVLSISAEQMKLYLEAADLVLDQVFGPAKPPVEVHKKLNFKDTRNVTSSDRKKEDGAEIYSSRTYAIYESSVGAPGPYRLRMKVRAVQSDQPVVVQIHGGQTGAIAAHTAGFFEVPPGEGMTIELIDHSRESSDNFGFSLIGGFPYYQVHPEYEGPGLWVGDVEVDGPIGEWPPPSRKQLLGEVDPTKGTLEDIRAILARVMPRAFRRPVAVAEMEPYLALAKQALDEKLPFEKALRRALKGVLAAPEFLYLEEPAALTDYAVATRLSYFLWSSMPDDALFAAAAGGALREPKELRAQVERMLADPKAQRFIQNFTDQWLRLQDIDFTVPNNLIYPEYNELLRRSMLDETHAFFRELLDRNLSVRNFIDSDFVMINEPLAKFYGIPGVEGLEMRRVQLPEDSIRGGVLTQASVLKVSADGTRTSPVLRGVWILKYLFGTPSPPPPPTVAAVEPDIRGATTIREQLEKHRHDQSCNRCHRYIDPPGFALESFDVIGAQRDWYRTREGGKRVQQRLHPFTPTQNVRYQQGPDVDPSGTMPDGRSFAGIREYKQLLLEDQAGIANAVTRQLMTYALGRHLGFSDRPEVDKIVASTQADDYGLRSLIHAIIQSQVFRSP